MDEELYACFIDWQEGFDRVKWKKINADPKWKLYRLARKKIGQQIVHGSEC
jgi:hypothetical protein